MPRVPVVRTCLSLVLVVLGLAAQVGTPMAAGVGESDPEMGRAPTLTHALSDSVTSYSDAESAAVDAVDAVVRGLDPKAPPEPSDLDIPWPGDPADASTQRYFVVLKDPPVAQYRGGIGSLAPTAVDVAGGKVVDGQETIHLDAESPAARAYTEYLKARQADVARQIAGFAPEFVDTDWHYHLVLNGFVARLTAEHALRTMRLPGVRLVHPEEELVPEMDATKFLIDTVEAWEHAGGFETAGQGARVAIGEPGNAIDHPFFNDEGMPPPPDGYPSARVYDALGRDLPLPEPERFVNNKVIGARVIRHQIDERDLAAYSPRGSSHGLHVSGTVAGRYGEYEYEGLQLEMGGVAPNAWVFHYRNQDDTPGLVKTMELTVLDEIDAINFSLGHVGWLLDRPETHPIALAMSAAADGGTLTVGSAGNAGRNGRQSLSGGWKYSEDIMVVGNTSSPGRLYVEVRLDEAPEELSRMAAGQRGERPEEPVIGELVYREDGGCSEAPEVEGKIAVVERFDADGDAIGPCGYTSRATTMAESGAIGIIYVYYDRSFGGPSGTRLAIPSVAFGTDYGPDLIAWMKAGNTSTATIDNQLTRDYEDTPDVLSGSSSRGPGLNWALKPDISAPGSGILSSTMTDDDTSAPPSWHIPDWSIYSGTSMAAPHITGAAGLVRSLHPNWTVPQLRSALINTSERVVMTEGESGLENADPSQGGPGRVNVLGAARAGAFLHPPKAGFGAVAGGVDHEMTVMVEGATNRTETWDIQVETHGGDATVSVVPESIEVGPGAMVPITVSLHTDGVVEAEHFGDILLTRHETPTIFLPLALKDGNVGSAGDGTSPLRMGERTAAGVDDVEPHHLADAAETLRLVYYAYVDVPENRDDVMIVNWTYGDTPDHTSYYTDVLDALGLSYTVWNMGEDTDHEDRQTRHPTFDEMYRHDMVILNANESPVSLQERLNGQYQYQNYMLNGGSFLIAGQGTQDWWRYLTDNPVSDSPNNRRALPDTFPYQWAGPSQNGGCEMCLARYYAGFTPELTATLSSRLLVPYPMAPDTPEMEVVLERHDANQVFNYDLDISTGAMAKDGAIGNQYTFASGSVASGYEPGGGQVTAELGDVDYGEWVIERVSLFARPLWTYTVTQESKVVGTYVAGQQSAADIAWNAMFWGFGLEGVGYAGDGSGTATRERLLGDTFNFLALNLTPEVDVLSRDAAGVGLRIDLGEYAEPITFSGAEVDWGDGTVERLAFDAPLAAEDLALSHRFAAQESAEAGRVSIKLIPASGTAAPVYLTADLGAQAPTRQAGGFAAE